MEYMKRMLGLLAAALLAGLYATAQDKIVKPEISYAGTPRSCEIGGLTVKGVEGYEDYVLTGISGLSVGQRVTVPGSVDSIVGSKVYLCFNLSVRPRVSTINYNGLKKSEREDLEARLGIMP